MHVLIAAVALLPFVIHESTASAAVLPPIYCVSEPFGDGYWGIEDSLALDDGSLLVVGTTAISASVAHQSSRS
jgi:hypothetical protein